jgi:tetratricopeptide (TPR) repeat protein
LRWYRSTGVIVFGIALAARLLHLWQMHDSVYFSLLLGDSRGYDAWAREIATGDWWGREVFYQAPLYPYFLGALYTLLGPDLLAVRVVQALLGAVACVALASAATRLVSARVGMVAGLMLALYPPAIFFDGLIQKSVLDVLFTCTALVLVARMLGAGTWNPRWMLLLGAVLGALALTRENALLLALVIAVWAWRRFGVRSVGMLAAGLALVLLPVVARNALIGGGFFLTTSQFGSNLYIGNNPRAGGSYMAMREGRGSPEFERLDATALAEAASGRPLTPAEVSAYWAGRTLDYIASDPVDWLQLLLRKTWLLVNATEIIDTESQESHAEHSVILRVLGSIWHFGVVLPLAVVGLWALWRERARLGILYALTAAYAISVVLFFVVARYRLPLVPFVLVFAAAGVFALDRRAAPALIAAAVAAAIANTPAFGDAAQRAITENNVGTALQQAGRVEEAIVHYQRALALDPNYSAALNNLGTALRASDRVDEAIAAYGNALAKDHDPVTVLINLGNARMAQGNADAAIEAFREAARIDPKSSRAVHSLANALFDRGTFALEMGRYADAAAALQESLRLRPDAAETHNNLGIALASQGRVHDAIPHWERAVQLRPDFADAHRNLERARRQ